MLAAWLHKFVPAMDFRVPSEGSYALSNCRTVSCWTALPDGQVDAAP